MRYTLACLGLALLALVIFLMQMESFSPSPSDGPEIPTLGAGKARNSAPVPVTPPTKDSQHQRLGLDLPRGNTFAQDPKWMGGLGGYTGRLIHHDGAPAEGYTVEAYGGGNRGASAPDLFLRGEVVDEPSLPTERFQPSRHSRDWLKAPESHEYLLMNDLGYRLAPPCSARSQTGPAGHFTLNHLFPGSLYLIRIIKEERTIFSRALVNQVTRTGKITTLGDIRLPDFQVVRGQVVDEKGKPIKGARIRAFASPKPALPRQPHRFAPATWALAPAATPNSASSLFALPAPKKRVHSLWAIPTTRSDSQGNFCLTGVAPGTHLLQADLAGYRQVGMPPRHRVLPAGGGAPVNLLLTEKTKMDLTVRDSQGSPLPGVQVLVGVGLQRARRPFGFIPMQAPGITDAQGRLALAGLPPGYLYFALRRGDDHPWQVMNPVPGGGTLALALGERATARFRCVVLIDAEEDEVRGVVPDRIEVFPLGSSTPLRVNTETSPNGVVRIKGLHPGGYLVKIRAPGYLPCSYYLTLDPGPEKRDEPRQVALQKGEMVSVLVLDPQGKPLPGAGVIHDTYWQCAPNTLADPVRRKCFRTDSAGRVVVGPLLVKYGDIRIRAWHPLYPDWGCHDLAEIGEELILQLEAGTDFITETMTPVFEAVPAVDPRKSGRVLGRVLAGGKPLARVIVKASAPNVSHPPIRTETDGDGRFSLSHSAPVKLRFNVGIPDPFQPGQVRWRKPDPLRCKLQPGQTCALDLCLPGGGIEGRVIGADGRPLPHVRVGLDRPFEDCLTGPDGVFGFAHVQGERRLYLHAPGKILLGSGRVQVPTWGQVKVTLKAIAAVRVPVRLKRATALAWQIKLIEITTLTGPLVRPVSIHASDGGPGALAGGNFYVDLPPGLYRLQVWENNLTGSSYPPSLSSPGFPRVSQGDLLVPPKCLRPVPVMLTPPMDPAKQGAQPRQGVVLGREGKPVGPGNLRLAALVTRGKWYRFVRQAKVDRAGAFAISLPAGPYACFFFPQGKTGPFSSYFFSGRVLIPPKPNLPLQIKLK